jgi:hypothetical protein
MLRPKRLLPFIIFLGLTGLAQTKDEARPLEPGQIVEREIASGQKRLYRITLTAGQFMRAGVEPRAVCKSV